ncbi:hypothetical protein [Photobacterium damselae]|uniref:hypothetical protein n=1 Tax=Photobacterium damselae TaxID=38293 RepID=UPI001F38409F|nr:hypothetical protein [Photobacterium damselae]UKA04876.1 hypothetical protein IHC89_21775 [Photobacterium damselae subsp. damselae]
MTFDATNANTIIEQLAGSVSHLIAMTGAKDISFSSAGGYVSFKLGSGAKRVGRYSIKYVKITLNKNDLYEVEFGGDKRVKNQYGLTQLEYVSLVKMDGVCCDALSSIFEATTGFYLTV